MIGAIAGDVIGSTYEFHPVRTKTFPLFGPMSSPTDDTILTVAVSEGLMEGAGDEKETERCVVDALRRYGRRHPHAGYGGRFLEWLYAEDPKPYGSWGNGSAMRVSPVGWMFQSLEETERFAAITARPTHHHPEGILGAQTVAGAVYLARTGASKEEIRAYAADKGYHMDRALDEIRPTYSFQVSCRRSVGESILCFLEGTDYEDAVRNAVSLGGDADTMACIAGAIAEAYSGVPESIRVEALRRLDDDLVEGYMRWLGFLSNRLGNSICLY